METSYQGLERNYFERVSYSAQRFSFDNLIPPSKRTVAQKFEMQSKKALNELIDLKLFGDFELNHQKLSDIFLNDYLKKIDPKSKNGAAFALVFCCFNFYTQKFTMKKHKDFLSWEDLVEFINKNPPSSGFKKFIDDYGIKAPDLIRYLIYARNLFEK